MSFEDTLTEEFERSLRESRDQGLLGPGDVEPDLRVEGLSNSLLAKILGFFGGKNR